MDVLLQSTGLVFLAEMGDKTQLLSILLAARYRVFWPIFFGILAATTLNHAAAAYAGRSLAGLLEGDIVRYGSGILFIVIGLWVLVPDKEPEQGKEPKYGAFVATLIAFFIAEMGDKTQLATITLGARYDDIVMVTLGTTAGMMLANIPAIILGDKVLKVIPLKTVRVIASLLFIGFGAVSLLY